MNQFLTQFIGIIGYILLAYSFFKKDKKGILFIQIFAYIALSIHYYFLNGLTGTYCNIISLVLIFIIYFFEKKKSKHKKIILISCTIPVLILITVLSYENIFSIFPIIASIITLTTFLSDSVNKIKFVGILSAICWLIYAIVYKSYSGMVLEILLCIVTVVAFIQNKKIKEV
jgi:hypothetical protein